MRHLIVVILALLSMNAPLTALGGDSDAVFIENAMVHLRASGTREWAWFAEKADAKVFERTFDSDANTTPWTLSLRQQNVKQAWDVLLNNRKLGRLVRDENDLLEDFVVPADAVVQGENRLVIQQSDKGADDIRIGQVTLHRLATDALRQQATIEVSVNDEDGDSLPCRITIMNDDGTLVPVAAQSGDGLAVRQGVVYSVTGKAVFGVAPGDYRIVVGRGFEYSIDESRFSVTGGQRIQRSVTLRRVVNTDGWVACDTHVHTVTHSGHGDCTVEERMVTLAGEGIEMPIATDHNKAIDYRSISDAVGSSPYFTPVIGDELTTKNGHFNIFPIRKDGSLPDHNQLDWGPLLDEIYVTPDVKIAILNHARDIHSGFRPFSPVHHLALTGENLDGRPSKFNALEICNSGAVQTDPLQLYHDWCGLLNRGLSVTPIGSSDSHDVARYVVGQGRTYIRCDDSDPGAIDVAAALDALAKGRVVVSYGLFTRLTVNQTFQPGDLVNPNGNDDLVVTVEVRGPGWIDAESVALYVCGQERFRQTIDPKSQQESSTKATVTWRIPRAEFKHDIWLSAVAVGPGVKESYWKTALPYQPTSPSFTSTVFSTTGSVRVDGDGDGKYTSPLRYAQQIVASANRDLKSLVNGLQGYAPSVIHQAASLHQAAGGDLVAAEALADTLSDNATAKAIASYRRAWRQSVVAKLERTE